MPEFSQSMLRLFLHARCRHEHFERPARCGFQTTKNRVLDAVRRKAQVTHHDMSMAWMGRLMTAETRARIWRALGLDPADYGVTLTHGGQENA